MIIYLTRKTVSFTNRLFYQLARNYKSFEKNVRYSARCTNLIINVRIYIMLHLRYMSAMQL